MPDVTMYDFIDLEGFMTATEEFSDKLDGVNDEELIEASSRNRSLNHLPLDCMAAITKRVKGSSVGFEVLAFGAPGRKLDSLDLQVLDKGRACLSVQKAVPLY